MSNQSLSELLTDLKPTLKNATGLGIIATVTIAAVASLGPQVAAAGLGAALTQFLGDLFGDTIAGPAMDQLLKQDNSEEREEAIRKLEAGLRANADLRADIAHLLKQQEVYTKVTGVALQYHENRIVERLMRAIAAHQEFSPADVVTALNNAYRLDDLHPEIQYLTNLIKDLKHKEGVWDEYIALKIQAQKEATAPQDDDLKKLTPDKLALLEQEKDAEQDDTDETDLKTHETIWEIIDKHPRFVLLGEPGAGKTTTIRHLALEMALDRLANPDDVPIPMVLSPSVWDDNLSLHGFVNQTWRMVADPFGLMDRGDMVMFIDGLNEMGQDRSSKIEELKDWIHGPQAPKRIIITCREDDYTEDLSLDLPQVFTEPMDDDRIEAFVHQYLGNDAGAFFQAMGPRRSELANNPYLLRALTIIYKHGEGNELPANDGQLLMQFVRSLWKREYDRNTPGWRDLSEVAPVLASLAYDMLDQKLAKGVAIPYVDAYMDETLRRVCVRANFLVEDNFKVRFYHQLMQEYFASLELVRRETVPRIQPPRFSSYTGHRAATDWDEVILAAGGLTDNADELVKDVARRDIWLAAECIAKGAEVGLRTRRSIKKKLLKHIDAEDTVKRTESLRLYWQLAGKEARPYMLAKLDDTSSRVRRLAVRALAEMPDDEVISRVISLFEDQDAQVRETVNRLLQKSNIDPEYIHNVVDYLQSENNASRLAAFKLITRADPERAFPYALSLTNDRDPKIRREVGRFIQDYYSPQVVRFLLAQSGDVSPDVRDTIRNFLKAPDLLAEPRGNMLKLLQQMGQKHHYAALKQYVYSSCYFILFGALPDDVPILKRKGLHLLKTLRKHPTFQRIDESDRFIDGDTIRVMIIPDPNEEALAVAKAMLAHPDPKVRYRAVRALGQLMDERFVPDFLTMMNDNNEQVVGHALISLAENNAPETYDYVLAMLEQNLATGGNKYARFALRFMEPPVAWLEKEIRPYLAHENKQVRLMGLLILADCNHPDVLSIAAEMLRTEDSGHVIQHAIRALADSNHMTPEIRSEIRQLTGHKNSQVRMAALTTLHALGDPAVLDIAHNMLEQETDPHVQAALLRILSEADAHEALPWLKAWIRSDDSHQWGNARKILIDRDDFVTIIEELLAEGDVKRATKIIEYLIPNGEEKHIEPLEHLNNHGHSKVTKRANVAINQIRRRLADA